MSFASAAKSCHRHIVANDVHASCHLAKHGGHASLVYISCPAHEDTLFFMSKLANAENVSLVAVNRGTLPPIDTTGFAGKVALRPCTELADVLVESTTNSFTHGWLDLTSVDIGMELLRQAVRCCTERVYVVLNVDRLHNGLEDTRERMKVRVSVFRGVTIDGEPVYQGASGKKNMIFFTLNVSKKAALAHEVDLTEDIGKLCWVKARRSCLANGYSVAAEKDSLYYTARVASCDRPRHTYGLWFYDANFCLATLRTKAPAKKKHVSMCTKSTQPLLEHHDIAMVRAHMQKRWGDTNREKKTKISPCGRVFETSEAPRGDLSCEFIDHKLCNHVQPGKRLRGVFGTQCTLSNGHQGLHSWELCHGKRKSCSR